MTISKSLFTLGLLLCSQLATALPRYAAQYGQSCHLCHVSPGGGGMRTSYGSQFFAGTELAVSGMAMEELEMLSPKLSERVDLGLDFRGVALAQSQDESATTDELESSSFFLMQGDVYLGIKISPRVQVVLEQGLRGAGESHALFQVLPWHGTVKAGRFLPNHGWRWADHNTAVRQALGFAAGQADTGVELELHPDQFSLSAAITNDASGMLDGDIGKALTLRALWQGRVAGTTLSLGAGGRMADGGAASRSLGGLFAGLSRGAITWTGQADRTEQFSRVGLAISQEFDWRLRRGVDLLYTHDFLDQDINRASGAEMRHRLGLEWMPSPGVALQPAFTFQRQLLEGGDEDLLQAEVQVHVFM